MKNIRGSHPYYQGTFYDLLAKICQLGTPTWFFTLSAADLKWPNMISTIAKRYSVHYTDEQIEALSFEITFNAPTKVLFLCNLLSVLHFSAFIDY